MRDRASQPGVLFWWLAVPSTLFLVSVPQHAFLSIYGEWFTLGWPFAGLALKVGYISPSSPQGPHLSFHPFMVLNAALWLLVFFGLWRAVRSGFLSLHFAWTAAALILVASAVFFGFGVAHLTATLQSQ